MQRITEVDQPGLAVRAFYKIGERMFGAVPTPERIMAHRVPLMLGMGGLWGAMEWCATLEKGLRALVQLHVAQLYGSAYWADIRHAVGVKVGVPATKLAALAAWETSPAFSDRERAALRFTTGVVRDDREVTDADWEQLRAHFSEPEVVELVFALGYQTFASKFAKAFRLAPQGFSG